jgi:TPR repeat protein
LSAAIPLTAQTSSYDADVNVARDALRTGDANKAYSNCDAARKLEPGRFEAYIVCASALGRLQRTEEAIGMLQMALVNAPDDRKADIRSAINQMRAMPPAQPAREPAANPAAPTAREIVLWKSIGDNASEAELKAYLDTYPNGTFESLAKTRLQAIRNKEDAASKERSEAANARDEINGVRKDTQNRGYWLDYSTGRTWAAKESQADVNWNEASNYCTNLRIGGYRDWTLPHSQELYSLWDRKARLLKGGVDAARANGFAWSDSAVASSGEEEVMMLSSGAPSSRPPSESSRGQEGGRALCVRRSDALQQLRVAAEGGNRIAMNGIGLMYSEGEDVVQDFGIAAQWYKKAAEAGLGVAMVNLAGAYRQGRGVTKDRDAAIAWYRREVAAGYDSAKGALKALGVDQNP